MDDYYDLGAHTRAVTTSSPDAQRWFDRGLNWLYGFNHDEAVACFERAASFDPDCAMAHWGVSLGIGPNYNLGWDRMDPATTERRLAAAHAARERAAARLGDVTPVEADLVEALAARYPQAEPIDDQMPWNVAFTAAMREVHERHPDDLDVAAVFVDAIMNETPWQMWDLMSGEPAEGAGTAEATAVLDRCFHGPAAWDHPGLLHLHVHLMEMSPHPEAALRTGDRLRTLVPDGGHLIHMPTHIDVQVGAYHDVVASNAAAIEADRRWLEREGYGDVYTLYRNHNHHFLIYGAMFLGQYSVALAAADELIEQIPEDFLRIESPPIADSAESFVAMKQHVLVRFGKWQEILDQPFPEDPELYAATTAMQHYARTVARAALGDVAAAEAERAAFAEATARVPETRRVHNNLVVDLLAIAAEMADGEIAYRRGDHDEAFAHLRRSVELEDALPYDEPWGWMQPTRHALGALLLEQGRHAEAEEVYRADLGLDPSVPRCRQHPDNLWALFGLLECLEARGEEVEAAHVRRRYEVAAARSEVTVRASCYCHGAAMADA